MDELDMAIVRELLKDGRMPFRQIAEKQGVSLGTIHNRIKKMKLDGIIKKFIPLIDESKLGYSITAIISISVSGGFIEAIKERLEKFTSVKILYRVSGTRDFLMIGKFKDMIDFGEFNKKINDISNMKSEVNIVIEPMKDSTVIEAI